MIDNFSLGFDEGSLGDTRVYVATVGHTWTLSPTLVLDGNFGANIQNQEVTGPDFGDDLGLGLGIRGTNGTDVRQSGLPHFAIGANNNTGYNIGTTPNWMPLFRKERSYTFGTAVTKVFQRHDVRLGVDVVRHALNHIQAEFGDIGGVRGGFRFNGTVTGAPGYTPLLWNEFGTFLLGLQTYGGKDVQTEEMTGREWQSAIYIRDRWQVSSNFTISAGLRLENYPLMSRVGRGIERLDLTTYEALLGGVGNTPDDVGINLKTWYFAPRLGAMYRFGEKAVARVGYGRTINPLPWSRPMRGSFPQDIFFNRTADQFVALGTLEQGIPDVPIPDISSGRVTLPRGVFMRSPNPNQVDRGTIQQWNVAYEYRLPGRHRGRSGLRRHAHGRRLRRPEPELRRSRRRQRGPAVLRARRHRGGDRLGGADQEPLSRPAGGGEPAAAERAAAEGRLHLQPLAEHVPQRRGRLDRSHLEHAADVRPELRDRRFRSAARLPDGRHLRPAVHDGAHRRRRPHPPGLADQRHRLGLLGHAVLGGRHQHRAQLPGLRQRRLHHHQLQR